MSKRNDPPTYPLNDNMFYYHFLIIFRLLFSSSSQSNTFAEAIEECSFKPENQTAGLISNKDINETYIERVKAAKLKLDCLWTIEVKPGWGVR